MSVFITNFEEFDNRLTFTISGIDLSYANALRRTIISDIPTLVFRTSPYEKNKCNIISNTGRLNNELVKQRLSCIPICIPDEKLFKHFINNYELELSEKLRLENVDDLKNYYLSDTNNRLSNQLDNAEPVLANYNVSPYDDTL